MTFFHSRIFLLTVLLQLAGPFLFGYSNWCNHIQYLSAFGMAYALWEYMTVHKSEIQQLREQLIHLHQKHEELHSAIKQKEGQSS